MLRLATIRMSVNSYPEKYGILYNGVYHIEIVTQLGGNLITERTAKIRAYFRDKDS